ncbi:MAG: FAD-dependent oxidoreductase [Bacteroidota bacterium]
MRLLTVTFTICWGLLILLSCQTPTQGKLHQYDLIVYGGTSAAVIAAVQAKKLGKNVAIVCPETHLGGMTASGLGWTDAGKQHVIGGLSQDFYHRMWTYYQKDSVWRWEAKGDFRNRGQGSRAMDSISQTMWTFEPRIAAAVYEDYIREYEIPTFRDHWLDRTKKLRLDQGKIDEIQTLNGTRFQAQMFIDATYEGDLMALAGVNYIVGRESNERYQERLNGIQTLRAVSHQFPDSIDPYVIIGDPNSGLLPRIQSAQTPIPEGGADERIQAYCYRLCLTQEAENRIPFPRPAAYDSTQYELMLRVLGSGWRRVFQKFDPIPNRKTDTNNHGPFSTDNIGYNYRYPEASYAERQVILEEHKNYQLGWLYFLANDPRVPEEVRLEMAKWGLAKDEFVDNQNWPHQIYVREARRMIGETVVNENHLRQITPTNKSVGMGSYNMDSHNVQRYVDTNGYVKNEGDIQINPGGPYPIDYGALVPQKEDCQNLLVPVCVSASHIAYGSIRMEPVFMILGQSAATAACMAIDQNIAVQDVAYESLKARLLADGQVLEVEND